MIGTLNNADKLPELFGILKSGSAPTVLAINNQDETIPSCLIM